MGQVDKIERGLVSGWACMRGNASAPALRVLVYVDGVRVGEGTAGTPQGELPLVQQRLCGLRMPISGSQRSGGKRAGGGREGAGYGFSVAVPPLPLGRRELRAFVVDGRGRRRELHHSPLAFREAGLGLTAEEALQRKDAIILLRNSQLTALWEQLRLQTAWNDKSVAAAGQDGSGAGWEEAGSGRRLLVAFLVSSGLTSAGRRAMLRRTWVPTGGWEWLRCAVSCCAVPSHTVPRRVLCCAVLCCAVLCCAVLCCAVLCCAVLCCSVV